MISPVDAERLLKLIAAQAKPLREAGVTSVELDGISFSLAPALPPAPSDDENTDGVPHADPWKDLQESRGLPNRRGLKEPS